MTNESRAFTQEEVRDKFLSKVKSIAAYWAKLPDQTVSEKCDGVAFSILSTLDGCSMDFPACDISLAPHQDDKAYMIERNENYFEPGMVINRDALHELYFKDV